MVRSLVVFCISTAFVAIVSAEPSATPSQPLATRASRLRCHIISHIPRQPVESTAIAKIGYSKRRHILEIEFVNGGVYRYFDVPATVYRDLMSSESKARFYDSNVRQHYRSVLIRSRQKEQVTK